jgi:hypothetical protein
MFDGILSQIGSQFDVQAIAERVGLTDDKVESAIAALGVAHSQPTDTVETAASSSGIPTEKLGEIMSQLGGENALSKVSSLLGQKGSNPLGGISGLFGE